MANQARLGLIPCGSQTRGQPRRYTLASGYTPSNSCPGVAPGEVVKVVTGNTIAIFNTGDTSGLLGVVAACSYVGTDGNRRYGEYVPAGHTYTGDASVLNPLAPWIEVWDDPGIEYYGALFAASATALTNFQMGFKNMDVSVTSATTVDLKYKRSLRTLTGTAATTNTMPFRVLDIPRMPSQDYGAQYLRIKVGINVGIHANFTPLGV